MSDSVTGDAGDAGAALAVAVAALDRLLADPATWRAIDPDAGFAASERVPERRATHGALLGFAGDRVLKIKKPVDLGFFDFTTPERRRAACIAEVELNRRLAAEHYLGVASIVAGEDGRGAIDAVWEPEDVPEPGGHGPDAIVDFAVVMKRLPESGMLDRWLESGRVRDEDIDRIARRLVRFHEEARRGPDVDAHAMPDAIRRELTENLEQVAARVEGLGDSVAPPHRVALICDRLLARLDALEPRLIARVRDGLAVDGHGDLHAGNICLVGPGEEGVVIFDCVEFEPAFRCGDPAREIGFLAMDLAYRGARDAADRLLTTVSIETADDDLAPIAGLFGLHYGMVRAKVDAVSAVDESATEAVRTAAIDSVRRRLEDAAARAIGPAVIILCGTPGTGKSRAADAAAAILGAARIRSDVVRKLAFGISPTRAVPAERRAQVYAPETSDRIYAALRTGARAEIARGRAVVLDAMHATPESRAASIAAAEAVGAPWVIVHLDPPVELVEGWIRSRVHDPENVSDADVEVAAAARARFVPPDEIDPERVVRLGAVDEPDEAGRAILARLETIVAARG